MKKRIIIAACCACCSWLANSAEGFSSPVAGVADHVVSGRILPPVVTWVDKPMVLSETNKIPAGEIGHFDIRLVSSPTKLRGIIFADRCGVGGENQSNVRERNRPGKQRRWAPAGNHNGNTNCQWWPDAWKWCSWQNGRTVRRNILRRRNGLVPRNNEQ